MKELGAAFQIKCWQEPSHGECFKIVTELWRLVHHEYIYHPGPGLEQFFDLESDPKEMVNLIDDPAWQTRIAHHHDILIRELDGRSESSSRTASSP